MDKSLFDIYTDYLICSFGLTTATGLARLLDGEISHDQGGAVAVFSGQNQRRFVARGQAACTSGRERRGVLILDDSIEEKPYTDENELICWYWDHAKERYVKGINFITAFYQAAKVGLGSRLRSGAQDRVVH